MRIIFACMLALVLGTALPAFAAAGTTAGTNGPTVHAATKHQRVHTTKHHKQVHHNIKKEAK